MTGITNRGYEVDIIEPVTDNNQKPTETQLELQNLQQKTINTNGLDTQKKEQLNKFQQFRVDNKNIIKIIWVSCLNIGFAIYFGFATDNYINPKPDPNDENACRTDCDIGWCNGYGMLLLLTIFVYFGLFYFQIVKRFWGRSIYKNVLKPFGEFMGRLTSTKLSKVVLGFLLVGVFALYLGLETRDNPKRLRPLLGIVVLLSIGFIFSNNIPKIKWRPVICGFTFQFLLGILCIRWETGRSIFKCFGDHVTSFLNYALYGSMFVFGEYLVKDLAVFAFSVLTVIFFFSFMISILYYWGTMQWVVLKLGWILQSILGTTVCESVMSAANTFLGMSESPLLITPYIKILTHSELHALMTSGFATVSGSVLAAYVSFGAEPAHLITSSVMAAPAALCFAKLFYPETEESKTTSDNIQMAKATDSSVLDAASNGASAATAIILGIIANLVAFVSCVKFIDGILFWLGSLVGLSDFTFERIFGTLFIPLSWLIGIEWEDCERVGILIATKTIVNEFVAYQKLGEFHANELISDRSAAIATYALCGFANPSSLGILIGSLSALCPERKQSITSVAFRAFISGSCVCFITASIAALLMTDDMFQSKNNITTTTLEPLFSSTTIFNDQLF